MINPLIFREYDIRGIAEKDLTDENIKLIVKAISSIYRDNGVSELLLEEMEEFLPREFTKFW